MTIEEIEIIVTAKVEEALKEFQKMLPTIKQAMKQAQDAFSKVDTKAMTSKVNKAVNFMKKKIENFKKSTQSNEIAIKVTNKDAEKQISQLEKEISSLQKKISERQMKLNILTPKIEQRKNEIVKEYMPEGIKINGNPIDNPFLAGKINGNKELQKMVQEATELKEQIGSDTQSVKQLKQELEQTKTTQNKLGSFFSTFKQKIEQAKPVITSIKNAFSQMPKITQNITNNIKGMSGSVKQGLGHVLKYAGALVGLRSIYNTLKSSASSWLSSQNAQAQQLSSNIEYMKYAMGSTFAPVIEYITNLVYQLMKAIQSLVYAFSGVNIFAKATASSMKSASGSAKEAGKSLAGIHNEINNVSDSNDSGSGGSATPNIDLSQMDNSMGNWIEQIKQKLSILFQPIENSWNNYGQPLIESIKHSFTGIKNLIETIGSSFTEVWVNGTGEHTVNTILQILTSVFNIIGNIGEAFDNAWKNNGGTEIIQNLWTGFNNLLDIVEGFFVAIEEWTASESYQVFANSIIEICNTLSGWFELITSKLKEIWDNGGKETFTKLLEFGSKLTEAIDEILKFLTPVVEYVLSIVTPVIEGVIKYIGYLIDAFSGILDFIIGIFQGDWEKAWNGIKQYVEACWNMIKTIIDTVINFIKSVIENGLKMIKTVWNNIWNGLKTIVSNVFNGIWNIIKKIINSILGGIEGMANGVVKRSKYGYKSTK